MYYLVCNYQPHNLSVLENLISSYKYLTRYMSYVLNHCRYCAICIIFLAISCTNHSSGEGKKVVTNPKAMDEEVADQIKSVLKTAIDNPEKIPSRCNY
jgi:hypothetical protein